MARRIIVLSSAILLVVLTDESSAGLLDGRPLAGRANIIVNSIESCPKRLSGENGFRFTNIKVYHLKDRPNDYIMSANFSLGFSLDDTITASIRMAEWTSRGGWKTGAHSTSFHRMCSTFTNIFGQMWQNIILAFYGHHVPCPLPPIKNRPLRKNITMKSDDMSWVEFTYGRWRNDILFVHQTSNTVKGCVRVMIEIAPRKTS